MIRIAAVGRIKEKWMREGIADYLKRIQPYEKTEIIEVEDEKAPESNSDAENEKVKMTEGSKLLKQIRDTDYVVLLDLAGKEMDSVSLSKHIESVHTRGYNRIVFVIGGSLGVSRELIARADFRWKLSVNTFPHQLCRIIVLEQIYRAFRILHHEPYHK
ncbi:MAG: 23S rRNA (pseudouridine(1915)-N(3))-methyltransferase RlmH [Erysipelotrichaceae bacterium]|nr:23S rRNA (pseudouridine(1915)-N(3))-methyltransferase RlmH [Erysipelotrichaceae bacterium]MDY4810300.1 23S rRNA (pseudouridine(1915)-N(3))-methyltransferase RlmH [Bulleidia sp.]